MEQENTIQWFSIPDGRFTMYNVRDDFQRFPPEIAASISAGVGRQAPCSAGGRLRFRTNSAKIYIKAYFAADRGVGFDLYRLENGAEYFAAGFMMKHRPSCLGWFEGNRMVGDGVTMHDYTLNMPYGGRMEQLFVGVDEGAVVEPGAVYRNELPVIFYGSSVVQGYMASRPGMTYVAQISQKYNLNYLNFGFAGNAKGEPAMAKYLAQIPMCAFVCDYDYNAPDAEHLERTHLPFYQIVRDKNPDIPYIIVTMPGYYKNPEENRKREDVIRSTYEYAKAHGDANVYFIEGKKFFNGDYFHACTVDGTHPNDIGFYRMAAQIGDVVAEALGLEKRQHDFVQY